MEGFLLGRITAHSPRIWGLQAVGGTGIEQEPGLLSLMGTSKWEQIP